MTKKRNLVHPNFMLGLLSFAMFFIAGMLIGSDTGPGETLAVIAFLLAGIHWVWGMSDAWTDRSLKNKEAGNFFWFVLILLIPPFAGMVYYMVHDKRVRV